MCRALTRREAMRYGALLAATFAARPVLGAGRALASRLVPVAMDLELVTVTDTEVSLTWFTGDPTVLDEFNRPAPVPADTTLYLGTSPLTMEKVASGGETAYHRVDVGGLRPGTTYWYRAESAGQPAVPTVIAKGEPAASGTFTTLVPPPGQEIGRVAWMNDVHWGEQVSGLAIGSPTEFPPGFRVDPADPYWKFMAAASIAEARARGARRLFVNGDLTSEAEPENLIGAKKMFDRFGGYKRDYFVTRGNHDRSHGGPKYDDCRPDGDLYDCMADVFFPDGVSHFSEPFRNRRFIGLDSVSNPDGLADLSQEFDYLEAELTRHDAEPTFVLFHHATTFETGLTHPGGVLPGEVTPPPDQVNRFVELVAAHPQVVGIYNGHTHRNYTSHDPRSGNLPFMEFGATKEYPGGYAMLRLFEGGYMVNFWKAGGPLAPEHLAERCRMWSQRSRGEYLGLYPYGQLGGLADRNQVHTHPMVSRWKTAA